MSNSKLTYSQRIEAKRNKRLHPSPQALAARKRAAERNNSAATERLNVLDTKATGGDLTARHLLAVTCG